MKIRPANRALATLAIAVAGAALSVAWQTPGIETIAEGLAGAAQVEHATSVQHGAGKSRHDHPVPAHSTDLDVLL
jgi:hypothetical protein